MACGHTVLTVRSASRQPRRPPLPPLRWDERLVLMKRMADIDAETRLSASKSDGDNKNINAGILEVGLLSSIQDLFFFLPESRIQDRFCLFIFICQRRVR